METEHRKRFKYTSLDRTSCTHPAIVVETSGVVGPEALNFFHDLGRLESQNLPVYFADWPFSDFRVAVPLQEGQYSL